MNPADENAELTIHVSERDHRRGGDDAAVTLVEYGDYECPHCAAAAPLVEMLCEQFGDRLRFAYRHFPLAEIHPHAVRAAEAAEGVGAQGKFWEMSRMLNLNHDNLDDSSLVEYALAVGANLERFLQDIVAHRFADRVREDYEGGLASGVEGTPTFFINGVRHAGGHDYATLVTALERAERHGLRSIADA